MNNSVPLDQFKSRQSGISFDWSDPNDPYLITQIAERMLIMLRQRNPDLARYVDAFAIAMDVAVVHCNGRRLRLMQLLMSDAIDFASDMFAIRAHLHRHTGKLPDDVRLIFQCNDHKPH